MRKSPEEMVQMQDELDRSRANFLLFPSYVDGIYPNSEPVRRLSEISEKLGTLDRLRRISRPPVNDYLLQLRDLQAQLPMLRESVDRHLAELVESTRGKNDEVSIEAEKARRSFASIPEQERELYRARREWGRGIIRDAKAAFPMGASNQFADMSRTEGQSYRGVIQMRFQVENRSEEIRPMSIELRCAASAAIGEHYKSGNCGEQASWVATEVNRLLPGTPFALLVWKHDEAIAHSYSTIGAPNFPETAYIDTWPTRSIVTDFANYGLPYTANTHIIWQGRATGEDLRSKVLERLSPLPPTASQTTARTTAAKIHRVHWIARTTDKHNSDSDGEENPQETGHTLSQFAMKRLVRVEAGAGKANPLARAARLSGAALGDQPQRNDPATSASQPTRYRPTPQQPGPARQGR
ncbi:hypothetical protein [Streptomyces bauhiniae]